MRPLTTCRRLRASRSRLGGLEKLVPTPEPYLKMRASRVQRSMMPPSLTRSSLTREDEASVRLRAAHRHSGAASQFSVDWSGRRSSGLEGTPSMP